MAACTVSGTMYDAGGSAISGATVRANIITPQFVSTTLYVPKEVTTTTASDGTWSLALVQTLQYNVSIEFPPNSTDSNILRKYSITCPASLTADFSTLATEL